MSRQLVTNLDLKNPIPMGGTTGQVLVKNSSVDYAMGWADQSGGGGGLTLPLTQNLTFSPDNTYDIGATAASRPRDVYVGRQLRVTNTLYVTGGSNLTGNVGIGSGGLTSSSLYIGSPSSSFSGSLFYGVQVDPVVPAVAFGTFYGVYARLHTTAVAANLTSGYVLRAGAPSLGSGSGVGSMYGLYVDNQGVAGVSIAYGVYISNQSGAGNVGLYNAGVTLLNNTLMWNTDNTYDIGAAAASRPRTIYAGTSVVTPLVDTPLLAPAGNVVEQRNGLNAQSLYIYNTYSDANNWERFRINWAANQVAIGVQANGTGVARPMIWDAGSNTFFITSGSAVRLQVNAATKWGVEGNAGHWVPGQDNQMDVGWPSQRPRTVYAGTSMVTPLLTVGGGSATNAQAEIYGVGATTWAGYNNTSGLGLTVGGGLLALHDTNQNAGNGGVLLFGAGNNIAFAGIKGFLANGQPNSLGSLNIATRRVVTDAALTDAVIIDYTGAVTMTSGLTAWGNFQAYGITATNSLSLPAGSVTTPMLAAGAAQAIIGSFNGVGGGWSTGAAGWLETSVAVIGTYTGGLNVRIEWSLSFYNSIAGAIINLGIGIDGGLWVGTHVIHTPGANYYCSASGVVYYTMPAGSHRVAVFLNMNAGVSTISYGTMYCTEQRR
jgi:hypothetical protein